MPPKPGLVRVGAGEASGAGEAGAGGASIEVEVWELHEAAFGSFVASIPAPMVIGKVELADGTEVPGFLCEAGALDGAPDITAYGGWRAYLASR